MSSGGDDLCSPNSAADSDSGLLEIPVSVGYNRRDFRRAHSIRRLAMRPWPKRLRCVGLLERLGIVRRTKLCPEQATATDMKHLIDVCLRNRAPCVVMMFHSSSLVPGCSPYVPDERAVERF